MTIEEILTAYEAGTYDQELAAALLHGLIAQQVQAEQRSMFAAAALQGMLSTNVRRPGPADMARECFVLADAMVAAAAPTPTPAPSPAPAPAPVDDKKPRK